MGRPAAQWMPLHSGAGEQLLTEVIGVAQRRRSTTAVLRFQVHATGSCPGPAPKWRGLAPSAVAAIGKGYSTSPNAVFDPRKDRILFAPATIATVVVCSRRGAPCNSHKTRTSLSNVGQSAKPSASFCPGGARRHGWPCAVPTSGFPDTRRNCGRSPFAEGSTRRRTLMRATSASLSTSNPGGDSELSDRQRRTRRESPCRGVSSSNSGNVVSVLYSSSAVTMTRWARDRSRVQAAAGSAGWVPGAESQANEQGQGGRQGRSIRHRGFPRHATPHSAVKRQP